MQKKFPIHTGNNGNRLPSTILTTIKNLSYSFLLLTTLSYCNAENIEEEDNTKKNIVPETLAHTDDMQHIDTLFVQKIKQQAQAMVSDSLTTWYTGLLDAMQSENWHLPRQEAKVGTYASVSIEDVTYIVMSFKDPSSRPYGTNSIITVNPIKSQVTINIDRIRAFCHRLQLDESQQKNIMEAIWLQEVYENKNTVQTQEFIKTDTINFLGEMISLLHGGDDYLYFRLHTLNKPVFLLSQLKGETVQTITDHGGYDIAENFYKQGMITYLQETNTYENFLHEQVVNTTDENTYLIQKYFSDTKALLPYILGE